MKFDVSDSSSYAHYVEAIDDYLAKYSIINDTRECGIDQSNSEIVTDAKAKNDSVQVCNFITLFTAIFFKESPTDSFAQVTLISFIAPSIPSWNGSVFLWFPNRSDDINAKNGF